jgi:LuxR family maltose regulon positive regulatory protein
MPAQQTLDALERANLFLIPLDHQRTWYRYHNLFGEFLAARLAQEQPGLIPRLHAKAAGWYYRNGMWETAIKHALSGQDFDHAAEWIEAYAEQAIKRSQVVTLKSWLEALPEERFSERPLLCIYHAWTLLLSGYNLEVVQARLQQVWQHGKAISGKARVLLAFVSTFRGDFARSLAESQQALQELDENDFFFRSIIAWVMGIREAWEGNFQQGIQALERAVQMGTQSGNIMVTVLTMSNQAELLTHLGQLNEARQRYEKALQTAVDDQGRLLPIAGMAMIGLGDLLREWNDLARSENHFLQGIELTEKWGKIGELDGYIGLARLRWAQADLQSAHQALARAIQVARSFDATTWDDLMVQAYQAQLWIAQGEMPLAAGWMKAHWPTEPAGYPRERIEQELKTPLLTHIRQIEYVTLAWLWIAQGQPAKAIDLLQTMVEPVAVQAKIAILLQIHILQAMAWHARGEHSQAQAALEKALAAGEPQGFVRTFLDFGPRIYPLIRQAARRNPVSVYLERLRAEVEREPTLPQAAPGDRAAPASEGLREQLSERELQILERMAAGQSNQEIAQQLVVATSTIKTHVNHIFRKLEVRTRTQAIARARELRLLR